MGRESCTISRTSHSGSLTGVGQIPTPPHSDLDLSFHRPPTSLKGTPKTPKVQPPPHVGRGRGKGGGIIQTPLLVGSGRKEPHLGGFLQRG